MKNKPIELEKEKIERKKQFLDSSTMEVIAILTSLLPSSICVFVFSLLGSINPILTISLFLPLSFASIAWPFVTYKLIDNYKKKLDNKIVSSKIEKHVEEDFKNNTNNDYEKESQLNILYFDKEKNSSLSKVLVKKLTRNFWVHGIKEHLSSFFNFKDLLIKL